MEKRKEFPVAETLSRAVAILNGRLNRKFHSAWDKGVRRYALDLLGSLSELAEYDGVSRGDLHDRSSLEALLLNGARDWHEYSEGGCSLIYDRDIAERLCCPSELKRCRHGNRRPNRRETWIDVQARALYQAERWIITAFNIVLFQEMGWVADER